MVKILIRKSIIEVIGTIWMPPVTAAYTYTLCEWQVDNQLRSGRGTVTRKSIRDWLDRNAGDFQRIDDFHASIEVGDETVDVPWKKDESKSVWADCMFGLEE